MPPRHSATQVLPILFVVLSLVLLSSCQQDECKRTPKHHSDSLPADTSSLKAIINEAQRAGDYPTLCLASNRLGKTYRDASRFAQSITSHNIAIVAAEKCNDSLLLAQTLNNLGTVYRRIGLMPQATDFHYKALDAAEHLPADDSLAIKARVVALNGLGNVYMTLNNYTQAEHCLRRALKGESRLGSKLGMAINYANIGSIFESQGRLDSADVYYDTSMALNVQVGSTLGIALCHTYRGQLCEKRGQLSDAIDQYEAAYQLLNGSKDEWHALTPCLAMARVNMSAGAYAMALHYLEQAKATAQRIGSVEHLADIYKLYYEVYDRLGDTRHALDAFRKADQLSDSLVSNKTINDVQNVRLNIERSRQQSRVEEAEKQALVQRQEKVMSISILTAMLVVVGSLLAMTAYWLRVRKRQQAMAADLQQAKDRFFTNITHEFRTPLTVIIAAADDILKRSGGGTDDAHDARTINSQSASLLSLINQLLDIAKLKQGGQVNAPTWRRGKVAELMANIAGGYVNMAAARGIKLVIRNEAEGEADVVPDYAERICRNLISNALKFTPDGGSVTLSLTQAADYIVMSVVDTGCGMSAEQQRHIFEPFYQAQNDSRSIGTGIGLSLVKGATEAMGWNMSLRSAIGAGSTFTITIPTGASHPEAQPLTTCAIGDAPAAAGKSAMPTDDPESDELSTTVLVIEDNPDVAYFVGKQLSGRHRVVYAPDGEAGWAKAQEMLPDLIISDVMMPGINGIDLCRLVRGTQITAHIPLIMVTAKTAHDDRLAGFKAGADAYLEKPFHADELTLLVEKLLESRRRLRSIYSQMAVEPEPQKPASPKAQPASETPAKGEAPATETPKADARPEITAIDAEYLSKIVNTIRAMMPKGEVDLTAVADKLCITRHQLNRKVNALCGMSTSNLVKQLRTARAKELLTTTDMPIGDIAMECGVDSVAYFSSIFKRETGVTPSQYRADNQERASMDDILP